jgi:hypothetical protein
MTDIDDEIDVTLRPSEEILGRMTLLFTTSRRVELEERSYEADDDDIYALETDRFEIHEWVKKTFPEVPTTDELNLLATAVGELDEQTTENRATDAVSALALGWVLGLTEHLSFDVPAFADIEALAETAPQPWDRPDKLAKLVSVRDEAETWAERERWYLVYIRGVVDPASDRDSILPDLASDAMASGLSVRNNELIIGDESYATLTQDFKTVLTGTAEAYVHALTWACGFGSSWEDVPFDEI